MGTDIRQHRFQCPCLKFCKECNDLKIRIHLKDNKETDVMKSKQKETDNVFILHNIKNVNTISDDFVPEFEKHNISCPRCRKITEFTKVLLQKKPMVDKKTLLGVCSHCLKERRFQSSCYECENNVKNFLTDYEQKEGNKQTRKWLSKMRNLLQDAKSDGEKYTTLNNNALFNTCQRKSNQVTKTENSSLPEKSKLKTIEDALKCIIKEGAVNSNKLLQSKNNMPTEILKELRKHFKSRSLHDLRKLKTDYPFDYDYTVPKSNREYMETLDIPVTLFKHFKNDLEARANADFSNSHEILSSKEKLYFKKDPVQASDVFTSRDTIKDISELYIQQKLHMEFPEPNNREDTKGVLKDKKKSLSLLQNRKYHSEEALLTSGLEATNVTLDKDFKYSFPGEKIIKIEPTRVKSSTELTLDTQNMLIARAEEKRKNEERYQYRLLERQLQKIARVEKISLENEKAKEEGAEQKPGIKEQKYEKELRYGDKTKSLTQEKQSKNRKEDKKLNIFTNKSKFIYGDKIHKRKLEPKRSKYKETIQTNKEFNYIRKEEEMKTKESQLKIQKEQNGIKKLKKVKETERQKEIKEIRKQNDSLKREKVEDLRKHSEQRNQEQQKNKDTNQRRNKSLEQEKAKAGKENNVIKEQNKEKGDIASDHLKKVLLELANEKREAHAMKKHQEESARKTREVAAKKEKEITDLQLTSKKQAKSSMKPKPEKEKAIPHNKLDTVNTKDIDINQINVRRQSAEDLILNLIQIKQSQVKGEKHKTTRLSELNITPLCIKEHQDHKAAKVSTCLLCINSDLELDVESILLKNNQTEHLADIVLGQKIFKYKPPLIEKKENLSIVPILFQTFLNEEVSKTQESETLDIFKDKTENKPPKQGKFTEQEPSNGVIRYALSDRTFIDKGWTMLPTEKVVRKMNVYRMRPAHPEFDWFEHNKNKRLMVYDTGEKLAEFDDNGLVQWFYKNGRIALDYYNAEEINAQQRIVVYSSGEPDEHGRTHPMTVLATFDYSGNGIVFDNAGKIRLKYNQTEGVLLDRSIGPVSHWKWHTLNDPPVLQKVMIDTQVAHKDPEILKMGSQGENITRPDNEEMLAIEFDNFIKEKSKKLSQTFKPFQIKMKALKINEYFSLKILDQATVYLIFRDGTINLKLNIGMILDHKEIVDMNTAEVGEVSNNLERFPALTNSLAGLQRSVAYAQRFENLRTDRERRLYPTEPFVSADRLTAPTSRPLRPPFRTISSGYTSGTELCKCSRKLSSTNLYYNTRLI